MTPQAQTRKDRRSAGGVDTLQHRHLAAIAGIIAKISPDMRPDIAKHFAVQIKAGNSRFDFDRFIRACEVELIPPFERVRATKKDLARAREIAGK